MFHLLASSAKLRMGLFAAGSLMFVFAVLVMAAGPNPGLADSADSSAASVESVGVMTNGGSAMSAHQQIDPNKVVGRETCKRCHDQEFAAWEVSAHGSRAWTRLDEAAAKDYAAAMNIAADQIKSPQSACVQCHGTPMAASVAQGNSCESCHGAAGGDNGWLDTHCDYGSGTNFEMAQLMAQRAGEDAAHRQARLKACDESGMNRADDALAIARNCFGCHIVGDDALIAAGHRSGTDGFDLVAYLLGEVRHNFLLDRNVNSEAPSLWLSGGEGRTAQGRLRLLHVIGKLADLEMSLRARAAATQAGRGGLASSMADRIDFLFEDIEFMIDDIGDDEIAGGLKKAFDLKDKYSLDAGSLGEVADGDLAKYTAAADEVAAAAAEFLAAHPDGSKLPDTIEPSDRGVGDVYGQ